LERRRLSFDIPHDSADGPVAQIINPFGQGTAASYCASWAWKEVANLGASVRADHQKECAQRNAHQMMEIANSQVSRVIGRTSGAAADLA
jgi:hypothetical protein